MRRSLCRLGRFAIVSLVLHIVAVELYHGIDCQELKKTKIDFSKVRKFVKPIFEKFKNCYGPGSKIASTSRKFGSNVVKSLTSNALEFLESFDKDNVFEETFKETDDLFAGFLDKFFKNSKEDEADGQESEDNQENGHDQDSEDDQETEEETEGDTGGHFGHETSDSKKLLGAEQKHNKPLEKGQSSTTEAEHIKSEDLLPEMKSKLEDGKEEPKSKSDHIKEELETELEHSKGNKENGDDQENGHVQKNEDDQADEESEEDTGGPSGDGTSKKVVGGEQKHNNPLEEGQSSENLEAEHIRSEDLLPELKSKLEDGKEEPKSKLDHTEDEMETQLEHFKGNKSPILGKSKHEGEDTQPSSENKIKKLEEDLATVKEQSKNELSEKTGSSQKVSKGEHSSNKWDKDKSPKHSESKHKLGGEKRTDQCFEKSEELFKNEHDRPAAESSIKKKTKYNKKLVGSDEKPNSTNGPSESRQRGPITLSFLRDIDVKFFAPVKVSHPKPLLRRKPSKFRNLAHPQKPQPSSQGHKFQPSHQGNEPQDPQPLLHPPKQDEPKLTHQLQKSNSPMLIKSSKEEEKRYAADKENQVEDCGFDCEPIT